jgi:hypothetical protein
MSTLARYSRGGRGTGKRRERPRASPAFARLTITWSDRVFPTDYMHVVVWAG